MTDAERLQAIRDLVTEWSRWSHRPIFASQAAERILALLDK